MMYPTSMMSPNVEETSKKNKEKSPTLNGRSNQFHLKLGYMNRRVSERDIYSEDTINPSKEKISELAAIILCRTQLRRGQPEEALKLIEKFIQEYGETPMIGNEMKKIQNTLNRA